MGCRSLIHIVDEDNEILCTIYTQWGAEPSGNGQLIKDFVGDRIVRNGIPGGNAVAMFNGSGCFAASLVAHMKDENDPGGVYMTRPGAKDHGEEYTYYLKPNTKDSWGAGNLRDGSITMAIVSNYGDDRVLYCGPVTEFDAEAAEAGDWWNDSEQEVIESTTKLLAQLTAA
jgi:hypothetical protein